MSGGRRCQKAIGVEDLLSDVALCARVRPNDRRISAEWRSGGIVCLPRPEQYHAFFGDSHLHGQDARSASRSSARSAHVLSCPGHCN